MQLPLLASARVQNSCGDHDCGRGAQCMLPPLYRFLGGPHHRALSRLRHVLPVLAERAAFPPLPPCPVFIWAPAFGCAARRRGFGDGVQGRCGATSFAAHTFAGFLYRASRSLRPVALRCAAWRPHAEGRSRPAGAPVAAVRLGDILCSLSVLQLALALASSLGRLMEEGLPPLLLKRCKRTTQSSCSLPDQHLPPCLLLGTERQP